jgi:copper resistance protein D
MTPLQVLALERAVHDASLAYLWGGGGFATILADAGIRSTLATAMRKSLLFSTAIAASTSVIAIPLQTAAITSTWASMFRTDLWSAFAFGTGAGLGMLAHLAICFALLGAMSFGLSRLSILLAALALSSLAANGHAADDIASTLWDIIHVLSATAWVGALVPFVLLMPMTARPELRPAAMMSMFRFSRIGHLVVALVLLSGLANTLLILGHLPTDPHSPYQLQLLLKIAVALAMTCLAVVNRYLFVPIYRRDPTRSQRLLVMGASAEIALGAIALSLVASFGLDDPAA